MELELIFMVWRKFETYYGVTDHKSWEFSKNLGNSTEFLVIMFKSLEIQRSFENSKEIKGVRQKIYRNLWKSTEILEIFNQSAGHPKKIYGSSPLKWPYQC